MFCTAYPPARGRQHAASESTGGAANNPAARFCQYTGERRVTQDDYHRKAHELEEGNEHRASATRVQHAKHSVR